LDAEVDAAGVFDQFADQELGLVTSKRFSGGFEAVFGLSRHGGLSLGCLAQCARTFSLMMAASLAVRMWVQGKALLVVFRRGLGVRAGGLVVSLR
jgi:hypothetical protein